MNHRTLHLSDQYCKILAYWVLHISPSVQRISQFALHLSDAYCVLSITHGDSLLAFIPVQIRMSLGSKSSAICIRLQAKVQSALVLAMALTALSLLQREGSSCNKPEVKRCSGRILAG